ncbi:MAG TPA: response regulator transcription factor [Actinomycetota bacterium]|nr:response regulator transcription factor [Actinomycetota bacterium]
MTPSPTKVLLVEDEISLAESVRYNLEREGLEVIWADSGTEALRQFQHQRPRLVLLDLMLPEMSGLDVCKAIRAQSSVPIIMLTAKDSESDKVVGLEMGADDYVTKPFSMRELVSRVRAQLRRAAMEPDDESASVLEGGDVVLDLGSHEATSDGVVLSLTPKEFALLQMLMERKGKLVTRDFLIDEVWGPSHVGDTKTLDVHIRRLREKIEKDPKTPAHILTVRGLGYKFVV